MFPLGLWLWGGGGGGGAGGGGGGPFFFQHKNIHLIYLLINEN